MRADSVHSGHGCLNAPYWPPATSARADAYAGNLHASLALAEERRVADLFRTWGDAEQVEAARRWERSAARSAGYWRSIVTLDEYAWEHMALLSVLPAPKHQWEARSRAEDAARAQRTAGEAVVSRLGVAGQS